MNAFLRFLLLSACLVLGLSAAPRVNAAELTRSEWLQSLKQPEDARRLAAVKHLLKDGGPLDAELARALAAVLGDSSAEVRRAAALGLERIGEPAKDALPALLTLAAEKDSAVRAAAIAALGALGPLSPPGNLALPALIAALNDPIPQLRVAAVEALRRHGAGLQKSAEARAALAALALSEKHPDVLNALCVCLAELEPVPPELAPFFAAALRGNLVTRVKAVEALKKIGPAAVSALLGQLGSDLAYARRDSAGLLEDFSKIPGAPKTPEMAQAFAQALKDSDAAVRKSAACALGALGKDALPALPELLKRLGENDPSVRLAAAQALDNMGVPAPGSEPALLEMLQDKALGARLAAGRALAKQGAGPALEGTLALLKSPRDEVRQAAAATLGKFGAVAEPGVAPLLNSDKPEELLAALNALEKMGGVRKAALQGVLKLLLHKQNAVRNAAVLALSRSGADAVPALLAALGTQPPEALPAANALPDLDAALSDALGRIGASAVPGSLNFIQEKGAAPENAAARIGAFEALGKIGPASAPALPLLLSRLTPVPAAALVPGAPVPAKHAVAQAQTVPVRACETAAVLFALGGIGRGVEAALPLLFEMLKDGEFTVRSEAARAISKIAGGKERIPPLTEILERCDASSLASALKPFSNEGLYALMQEFDTPNPLLRQRISAAFGNMNVTLSAPVLADALRNSTEPKVRAGAAFVLGELRQQRKPLAAKHAALDAALPALEAALEDSDADVRVLAAYACMKAVSADDPALIARIASGVAQCAPENRSRALIALNYYNLDKHGRSAAAALPVLLRGMNGEYSNALQVKTMLQQVGVRKDDLPALLAALKDKVPGTRRAALKLLEALGPEAKDACPALLESLLDDDKLAPRGIEAVFDAVGPEAVPYLIDALKSAHPGDAPMKGGHTRRSAPLALVLAQMKLDGEGLQRVADLLVEERPELRAAAVTVLSAGPERAKYALPHLKELLGAEDKLAARQGQELIALLGAEALPALLELAKDPRPHIRAHVAAGLRPGAPQTSKKSIAPATAGLPVSPEVLAALLGLLKDEAPEVKAAALLSLTWVSGAEAEIIREMPAALHDENVQTRRAAVQYLQAHGAAAPRETIGALALLLKDPGADPRLRQSALEALAGLGPDALQLRASIALNDIPIEVKAPEAADPNEFVLPKAPDEAAAVKPPAPPKILEVSIESLLFDALKDPEQRVRLGAAEELVKLGLDSDGLKKILINEMFAHDAIEQYAHAQEGFFIRTWDEQRVHYYAALLRELTALPPGVAVAQKLGTTLDSVGAEIPEARRSILPLPYHGYWFLRLEAQGANAPGGSKKFAVEGKFSQGHGLAAVPDVYGKSGRLVFLIGDDGTIYKKDLGTKTASFAASLRELNPGADWEKLKVRPKEELPVRFHPLEQESTPLEF